MWSPFSETHPYPCCWSTVHGKYCYLYGRLAMQMEKWDGIVINSMSHAQKLGTVAHSCLELMHQLTAAQCQDYIVGKGKTSMLKTFGGYSTRLGGGYFNAENIRGLFDGLGGGCVSGSREQLIAALYGQPSITSMATILASRCASCHCRQRTLLYFST